MNRKILVIGDKSGSLPAFQPLMPMAQGNLAVAPEAKKAPFEVTYVTSPDELTACLQKSLEEKAPYAGVFLDFDFLGAAALETVKKAKASDPELLWFLATSEPDKHWEEVHRVFGQEYLDRWDFVAKPVTPSQLLQKCWRLVSSWDRRSRIRGHEDQLVRTERLVAIGTLARGLGNEFSNQIQTIMTKAELALTKKTAPDMESALKAIVTTCERASAVVKNLQSLVKMETARESVNLEGPIKEAISLIEFEMKKSKVVFVPDYDGALPNLKLNRFEINQAFLNIMVNAIHAMEKKGGELRIKTVTDPKGIAIHFSDQGCGIPAENLEKIFEPLFTTKVGTGSGIGLSVTRRIVENHGGKLSVSSEVGKGTTFTIWLPK